ncbi:MAG: hypothetical protein GY718_09950 [Lentisphaerae bacterium]|nr:hypothetical protein [Lentisphaerota bacterium]
MNDEDKLPNDSCEICPFGPVPGSRDLEECRGCEDHERVFTWDQFSTLQSGEQI